VNILEAIDDPKLLGRSFKKKLFKRDTWRAWRAFLCALFALPFEDDAALQTFRECTGRIDPPSQPFRESFICVGRRAGKSFVTAAIAVFVAALVDHSKYLSPGEVGIVMCIGADKNQAKIILNYVRAFFASSEILRHMVRADLSEGLELKTGVQIRVMTGNFRSVRGFTILCALLDELAFFSSDEGSANPDSELVEALRPGMASVPDAMLIGLSSPYAKRGVLYREFKAHFGKNDSETLIWKAASQVMNPSLSSLTIKAAYLRDASVAASEYGGEFRSDLESFVSIEVVEACVAQGCYELPPRSEHSYRAFCDPSGGRSDSMTMAVGHVEKDAAVLDLVAEAVPPFSPEVIVRDFCDILKRYRVSTIVGDKYGAEWVGEQFRKCGVVYKSSELNRSEIYLEILPALTSGTCRLLDNRRLVNQLVALERRTARSGKDSIDHPPAGFDDVANSACGVLVLVRGHNLDHGVVSWIKKIAAGIIAFPPPNAAADNPRTELVGKQRAFELEKKLRGIATHVPPPETLPKCPACKATCVNRIASGFRCNQCGSQFSQAGEIQFAVPAEEDCCVHPAPQIIPGGLTRCANCGRQSQPKNQPTIGVSRRDVLSGRYPTQIRRF
jgi:ribosomal protein L37AE/L43A